MEPGAHGAGGGAQAEGAVSRGMLPGSVCAGYTRKSVPNRRMRTMKAATHPKYEEIHVKCACGNSFLTRSTHRGDIHVEICSACHPFFTGKQKVLDTAGRIERFRR